MHASTVVNSKGDSTLKFQKTKILLHVPIISEYLLIKLPSSHLNYIIFAWFSNTNEETACVFSHFLANFSSLLVSLSLD